ncbi:MAG: AtpZ/AtpI family protein [Crocinitomicaceae bacterium]|jgi:F0F1-type ATP synthase assembly protein I|nr:AtpZ/AtpI family protein [Crocinitomicaceae bacterium]
MKNEGPNKFVRFSGLGMQMAVIIGLFSWLGVYLDRKEDPPGTLYTVIFCLLGVCIGLYLVIREVIKMSKDDE